MAVQPTMPEWVIDVASIIVEAETEEEARSKASDYIEDGSFQAEIVNIERWDT